MYNIDFYSLLYSPINIISTLIFLLIIIGMMLFKSNKISLTDPKKAKLFRLNVYHKLLLSSVFAVYYIVIMQGGDTYAYWKSTEAFQNLMFHNFDHFWELMTTPPTMEKFHGYFNYKIGYPMRFIYVEEESFFVVKILYIFRLLTLGSYFATTFIFAYITASASWKIYELVSNMGIFKKKLLQFFILFIPSVAFWASGIAKDTIVLVSIFYMIWSIYNLLNPNEMTGSKLKYYVILLFFAIIVYNTRPFILNAMVVPLVIMYSTGIINKIKSFAMLRFLIKGFIYSAVIGGFLYSLIYINAEQMLQNSSALNEAMVIQQDFAQNTATYGEEDSKRYSLGEIDYSPLGIIKAIPASILAGIYRPFLWEALRPSLIFNGLESMLLIGLSIYFLFNNPRKQMKIIGKNEILIFSVGFVLVIAFMAGFTSILFGVLVRLRAPLLPFFGLLLSIDWKKYDTLENEETQEQLSES